MNILQETTFNHSVAGETSPDIEYSDDLAESEIEIEKTEVVKKFIFKTKDILHSVGEKRNGDTRNRNC